MLSLNSKSNTVGENCSQCPGNCHWNRWHLECNGFRQSRSTIIFSVVYTVCTLDFGCVRWADHRTPPRGVQGLQFNPTAKPSTKSTPSTMAAMEALDSGSSGRTTGGATAAVTTTAAPARMRDIHPCTWPTCRAPPAHTAGSEPEKQCPSKSQWLRTGVVARVGSRGEVSATLGSSAGDPGGWPLGR